MGELVYAVFHNTVKNYLSETVSDADLANFMFGAIIYPLELKAESGEPLQIYPPEVSKLVNRNLNVPKALKNAASSKIVIEKAPEHFKKNVTKRIGVDMEHLLIADLCNVIDNDPSISIQLAKKLKTNAQPENIHLFLSNIFLYVAKVPNKKIANKVIDTYKSKSLPVQDAPKGVQKEELLYVQAIFDAYADKLKVAKIKKEDLGKYGYEDNFNRQRKSYYNAEFLGRVSRDAFADETPEPYEALKEEIESGVIDTWESNHEDGFERMSSVLTQATNTTTESTLLGRDTKWVSNDVKKGICHVLVNEKKLKGWVKK